MCPWLTSTTTSCFCQPDAPQDATWDTGEGHAHLPSTAAESGCRRPCPPGGDSQGEARALPPEHSSLMAAAAGGQDDHRDADVTASGLVPSQLAARAF